MPYRTYPVFQKKNSPREIVTSRKLDMKKDCRARFGVFVEASKDADITNTMAERTHSCLALGPSRNLHGSVKCFDLLTGKVVVRRTIKVLPMPDSILKLINRWGSLPDLSSMVPSWNSLIEIRPNSIGTMTTLRKTKALWNQIPPRTQVS